MNSDFTASSIAHGLKEGEFDDLSPSVNRKLVRLMARIAEQSYRRGFQHGAVLGDRACVAPYDLRFRRSLDKSPYTNSARGGHTSIERLFMECGELCMLGFDDECSRDGSRTNDDRACL